MASYLSKSKYISGHRCLKLLWTYVNNKSVIPPPSTTAQYILDQGTDIGILAQKLFPTGKLIDPSNFWGSINTTKTCLNLGIPLFEAAITSDRLYARADILAPDNEGGWYIYEVKSSASVKEEHIRDVAFQRYVFTHAKLKITKCFVIVINSSYLYDGDFKLNEFFRIEDVTEKADAITEQFDNEISTMLSVMDSPSCPNVSLGTYCKGARYCEMIELCSANLPEQNVTTLVADNEGTGMKLIMDGIYDIKDIPEDYELNRKQEIQRKCTIENIAYIDSINIKGFLDSLEYPLYFLDFETVQKAFPMFPYSHPYQQIPFQYSLHRVDYPNAEPVHFEYLNNDDKDPRPRLFAKLRDEIGTKGSVLVYYDEFEKSRLKEASQFMPEYSEWIENVLERIVDVFEPFKNLYYYSPAQNGSLSLKKVLPALTGVTYDDLEIRCGEDAPRAYQRCREAQLTREEYDHLYSEMLKYCSRDTEALIRIIQEFRKLISA